MASTILADNGVVSGSAGIKSSADSSGVLALASGTGTTAVTIDTSQNVGIGVTPSSWSLSGLSALQIKSGSAYGYSNEFGIQQNAYYNSGWKYINSSVGASQYTQNNATHVWQYAASGTAGAAIAWSEAMRIDSSGNVGIGTSSPDTGVHLRVYGNAYYTAQYGTGNKARYGADANGAFTEAVGATPITFYTNSTERARIDSSGNLLVGTTSASATAGAGTKLISSGAIYTVMSASTNAEGTLQVYSTGAGAFRFYVGLGGTVYATSTTITGISDQRVKENIRDLDEGLTAVMALKPRKFDWKEGKGKGIANDRGFIAQEFEQVFPDMIEEWKDPAPEGEEPYKAVNANLIPTLVKAIQEQQALINNLTERLAALEAK